MILGLLLNCNVIQAKDYFGVTHLANQKLTQVTVYGPADFSKIHADSITVKGTFAFDNLSIQNKLESHGPTEGKNSEIGNLVVYGPLQLDHCIVNSIDMAGPFQAKYITVSKNSVFRGPFSALGCHLQNITLLTDGAVFDDSDIKSITMKKNDDPKEQIVTLKGKTIVSGDITFESGKGKVIIENPAKLEGKIIGAHAVTGTAHP